MYHIFLIHSLVKGLIGCFQVLAMTNNAAMNILEHMFFWYNWTFFGFIPKSDIAGSWGRLFPNFLRNRHTDIQRGCTSLHSPQNGGVFHLLYILSSISCHQCFWSGPFWWNLRVALICISLKDVEHFLKCLSAILDSSVESSLFMSLLHFILLDYLFFWWSNSWVLCMFWRSDI